ncbi:putative transcriptional regulator LuxR [Legionella geestiana]|uniref:Putative transcriptional regulator LuxR n=3 Tax=Legionella geestiana TaxID=45065 RepID=A0A0W0TU78_9GAMM|nr:putative transcriptional regulator LuxR [Legionella geestiana]QBS12901.1 LuxR family transcriptional regulator [Legionella geestiana]QDQ41221.1 helix-turn-helix transcriptional regulator [Legionella geestiana]STX54607.1 transcription regulator protein, response regulator containing CheY-like receiver domain and HTH DNA-binding domain [Legionella geestiana]
MNMMNNPTIIAIVKTFKEGACPALQELCKPLERTGINSFFYSKFIDGNRVNLISNNGLWLDHLQKCLANYKSVFENSFHFKPGFSIDYMDYFPKTAMHKDMSEFSMNNAIYLTNVSSDRKFSEVFIFATEEKESNMQLEAHINYFNEFCFLFKDTARKIIQKTQVNEQELQFCNANQLPPYGESKFPTLAQRYYLGAPHDDCYLTNREFIYLKKYLHGLSAKEIGNLFNLSARTVESRLAIIKQKLDCKNKSELLECVIHSQLFYPIFLNDRGKSKS